jgi:hypothetical protein
MKLKEQEEKRDEVARKKADACVKKDFDKVAAIATNAFEAVQSKTADPKFAKLMLAVQQKIL